MMKSEEATPKVSMVRDAEMRISALSLVLERASVRR